MSISIQQIADQLKAGRELKGLSQRELSELSGVPQGHISRIERGSVDLRLSSLVELARALDLEPMLVPRKTVTAVGGIIRSATRANERDGARALEAEKELGRLNEIVAEVSSVRDQQGKMSQVVRQLSALGRFRLDLLDSSLLRKATNAIRAYARDQTDEQALVRAFDELDRARNRAVHASRDTAASERPRAAYALTGEEDD